jgi:hypothetical protein
VGLEKNVGPQGAQVDVKELGTVPVSHAIAEGRPELTLIAQL